MNPGGPFKVHRLHGVHRGLAVPADLVDPASLIAPLDGSSFVLEKPLESFQCHLELCFWSLQYSEGALSNLLQRISNVLFKEVAERNERFLVLVDPLALSRLWRRDFGYVDLGRSVGSW